MFNSMIILSSFLRAGLSASTGDSLRSLGPCGVQQSADFPSFDNILPKVWDDGSRMFSEASDCLLESVQGLLFISSHISEATCSTTSDLAELSA